VVDVEGRPVDHEGGHGFHTGRLCVAQAAFLFREVDDLDIVPGGVEGPGDLLLGTLAHWAARVVEYWILVLEIIQQLGNVFRR